MVGRIESNSELLRSYSGAKHLSPSASSCRNKKPTMIKGSRWNCPHCQMGSPRHWNVERHIRRLHEGLGEPVTEFGKTREQCQIDMNLQYGHNHQNTHKLPAFRHDQYKESRFSATYNYGTDNNNNNKFRWDFMDDIIEPAKKMLEFTKVLGELAMPNQRPSHYYYYPSAIPYQYPLRLSTPINLNNLGSTNVGNNSVSTSITNESNNKRITEGEPFILQVYARAAAWFQSRNWSSPSRYWWEQCNTT